MIEVRRSSVTDTAAIRAIHLAAFPTALEADLVARLDDDGDSVISLVAAEGQFVLGHVLFSRMQVTADGRPVDALGLGPVAVLPDRQQQGIGSSLIENGIAAARQIATELIFVLGDPRYYGRFGFDASEAAPFASPYAGPYFQALNLTGRTPPALANAEYAAAFRELA